MTQFVGSFFMGFIAPVAGFRRLLTDSELRALAIIPLLISLSLGSVLTIAGLYGLSMAIGSVSLELGTMLALDPGGFASVALTILLWPIGLLILGVGIYVLVRLIAAPFYSILAEKTLVKLGLRRDRPFVFSDWLWISLRMLAISLVKAVLFTFASVILFVFSLVPIFNVVAAMGFIAIVAFDISDYAFEAMEWPLAQRVRHFRTNWVTYSGLACGMGLAMLIPGVGIVLLPSAVIGASEVLRRTLDARV